jgi:hypothetical protein
LRVFGKFHDRDVLSPTVRYIRFWPGISRAPKVMMVPVMLGAPGMGTLGRASL